MLYCPCQQAVYPQPPWGLGFEILPNIYTILQSQPSFSFLITSSLYLKQQYYSRNLSDVFRTAKTTHLFKTIITIVNYRPTSLITVFSKVLETLFKIQLWKYIEVNNVLTCLQYGRVGKNTEDRFFDFNQDLNGSIANNKKHVCFLGFN